MEILFHKDAEIEFNHSIDYYKAINPILGIDFTNEVYKSIHYCPVNFVRWVYPPWINVESYIYQGSNIGG